MYSLESLKEKFLSFFPSQQQWKFTFRNQQPVILNAYSLQQFKYYFLPPTNKNINIIFQNRQKYALPNTPKIIALPNKNKKSFNQASYLILGQKAPYNFERLLKYHKQEKFLINFCHKLFCSAQMLVKKYGYFDVSQEMINASKGPSLIFWINQNIFQNKRQYPLINMQPQLCEDIMIRRILRKIISKVDEKFLKQILGNKDYFSFYKIKQLLKGQKNNQRRQHISYSNSSKNRDKIPDFLVNYKPKKKQKGQHSNVIVFQNNPKKYGSLNKLKNQRFNALNFSLKNQQNTSQFQDTIESTKQNFYSHIPSTIIKPSSSPKQPIKRLISSEQKRIQIRDSGNSLSTHWYSLNASGRKKLLIQINNSFETQKRKLLSTFGSSNKDVNLPIQKLYKESRKLHIKQSKIIEENMQDTFIQSPVLISPNRNSPSMQNIVTPGEQLQKQFSHLFKSGNNQRNSYEIESQIQSELNRLLFE